MADSASADRPHIVWDWNGTLFNDLELSAEALSVALACHGRQVTPADYHEHFAHPVRGFYSCLVGHEMSDDEWLAAQELFHATYRANVDRVALSDGALEVIERWAETGGTQSVLSLWFEDDLVRAVGRLGLGGAFVSVNGRSDSRAVSKVDLAREHVASLRRRPGRAVVVGDSVDDARAATEVGFGAILYTGGLTGRQALLAAGSPTVDHLSEVLEVPASTWQVRMNPPTDPAGPFYAR